jgi:hypothetical protein
MRLFPSRTQCVRNIRGFPESDASELAEIWQALGQSATEGTLIQLGPKVLHLLRRWQAYRNQPSPRNESFIQELVQDSQTLEALSTLIQSSRTTTSLASILGHRQEIERVYNFLKEHMLQDRTPARIVTVSKALLMLAGFTPALDSVVLDRIKKSNPNLLACPGVWPFCLYYETLQFVSSEQTIWEGANGPISKLLAGVPIGQMMDRILWRRL